MRSGFLIVCLFVVNHANLKNAQDISGNTLASELDKLADSIGWLVISSGKAIKEKSRLYLNHENSSTWFSVYEFAYKI